MPYDIDTVFKHVDDTLDDSLERLKTLLRIPSVSTDPAFDADVLRCAECAGDMLRELDMDVVVHETIGHPIVIARDEGPGTEDAPTFLFYGHYDVQPPDPIELWDSDPFDPQVVEGEHGMRIVARGADDDKGQFMTFVEAFRAWKAVIGPLPVKVIVLLEGEEESGSRSLDPFLTEHRQDLQADACIICDTGMWDRNTPAITTMLRGIVGLEAVLHGPEHDLHSGMYGGAVLNPINALTRIVGELHDADGHVQVDGFYDNVLEPAEIDQWNSLGFDEAAFLASGGCAVSVGESGRSILERTWSRPTCDANGIYGGYQGAGGKTVIASKAGVKLTCRLVPDQDAATIRANLEQFFIDRTPPGGRWEFMGEGAFPAIRVATDSPWLAAARKGLERAWGNPAVLTGCGGSIPVVGSFKTILGIDSLLVGFGLDDDRVHSPNEKYDLRSFHTGIKSHIAILEELAMAAAG